MWRDGLVLFIGAGEFLSYGTLLKDGTLRINPLVLAETCYAFSVLAQELFRQAKPEPEVLNYTIALKNLNAGPRPGQLLPGPIGPLGYVFDLPFDIHSAPDSTFETTVQVSGSATDPGVVAYRLVREVYLWFGIGDDRILYTALVSGDVAIGPEKIIAAGNA